MAGTCGPSSSGPTKSEGISSVPTKSESRMKSEEGMDSAKSADELPVSEQTHAAGQVTPSVLQSRLLRTRRQQG